MNVESAVEKVSVGTTENVIAKEESMIVKETAVAEFVRTNVVSAEVLVSILKLDIVIVMVTL